MIYLLSRAHTVLSYNSLTNGLHVQHTRTVLYQYWYTVYIKNSYLSYFIYCFRQSPAAWWGLADGQGGGRGVEGQLLPQRGAGRPPYRGRPPQPQPRTQMLLTPPGHKQLNEIQ